MILIPYPAMASKSFNACTEPCDMLQGPCACGGTHIATDWNEYILSQSGRELFKEATAVLSKLEQVIYSIDGIS